MGGSPAASTGLLCCKPYRLPPGCTAEYRFAVDRARPFACPEPPLNEEESRLNAFAVLAFCAEITLLPGHWAPRFTPENATAHTTPSRSTMVAHIWLFNPLVSVGLAPAGRRRDSVHPQVLHHLSVMIVGMGNGKAGTVQARRRSSGHRRLKHVVGRPGQRNPSATS